MTNINKILVTVVVCVFMICVASVSIVKMVTSDKAETTAQVTSESTTSAVDAPVTSASDTQYSTLPAQTTTAYADTTVTASAGDLKQQLLGKWSDTTGMSSFEFFEDGTVDTTYFNLSQLVGIDLSGTTKGLYTLEGDVLTVKFSIYTATIKFSYRITINGNELSMYNIEEHSTATYTRVS